MPKFRYFGSKLEKWKLVENPKFFQFWNFGLVWVPLQFWRVVLAGFGSFWLVSTRFVWFLVVLALLRSSHVSGLLFDRFGGFWVVLGQFRSPFVYFCFLLGRFGSFWFVLGHFRSHFGSSWLVLCRFGSF